MNGDLPVLNDDLNGVSLPHVAAARMFLNERKRARSTDARGIITMPLAFAVNGLRGRGCDEIVEQLERARQERLARSDATWIQIGPGRMLATCDLGIDRLNGAGRAKVQDATDDPVLSRLMDMHRVKRLARIEGGIDGRWRMHARSAHPYVNYVGLPAELPPFILRPHSTARASLVEIELGQGVTYSNLGAFRMVTLAKPLPDTIVTAMSGKPVTEIIAHPALEGLMFAAPDDHVVSGAHVVVEMDTN